MYHTNYGIVISYAVMDCWIKGKFIFKDEIKETKQNYRYYYSKYIKELLKMIELYSENQKTLEQEDNFENQI